MTKDSVLAILRNAGDYVSGEKISKLLGVSRSAVNLAIKSLRNDGYDILSSTNRGYFLKSAADKIDAREISAHLPAQRMLSVRCEDTVDSTNNLLRELAFKGAPDGQVVVANEQTQGRGRRGRTFVSPKDKGIYLSMLFRPNTLPSDTAEITAWTAVAVRNAVKRICGIYPSIKWVNDLLINGRKICGILTEVSIESESGLVQHIIIGVGVNVNESPRDFPEELQKVASSLFIETGKNFSRAALAAAIIEEMDNMRASWPHDKEQYLKAYTENNFTIGKKVSVLYGASEKYGFAEKINDDFSLAVRFVDGTAANVSSGEVKLIGI